MRESYESSPVHQYQHRRVILSSFLDLSEGTVKPYDKLWYLPIEDDETADLAVRFTLSQCATAAIPPGESQFFWKAVEIAACYSPVTPEETDKLKRLAAPIEPLFRNV